MARCICTACYLTSLFHGATCSRFDAVSSKRPVLTSIQPPELPSWKIPASPSAAWRARQERQKPCLRQVCSEREVIHTAGKQNISSSLSEIACPQPKSSPYLVISSSVIRPSLFMSIWCALLGSCCVVLHGIGAKRFGCSWNGTDGRLMLSSLRTCSRLDVREKQRKRRYHIGSARVILWCNLQHTQYVL